MVLLRVVDVRFRDDHGDQVEAVLDRVVGPAACHRVRTHHWPGLVVEPVASSLTVSAHAIPLPALGHIGARGRAQVHADPLDEKGHLVGDLADVRVGVGEDRETTAVAAWP